MTVHFHTLAGGMVGVDVHGCDAEWTPHIVGTPFLNHNNHKFSNTVWACKWPLLQRGFQNDVLVPHVAVPPPATPLGGTRLAMTNLFGNSKAAMGVASVTSEGSALATAHYQTLGLNLNCQSLGGNSCKLPTGVTLALFPVVTEPTLEDYRDFAITWAWDAFASYIMARLANKSTEIEKPDELQQHAQNLVRSLVKYIWGKTAKPLVEQEMDQRKKLLQTTDTALE